MRTLQAHLHGGRRMSYAPYIDPIEHAWRHCNPYAPVPSALLQRAAPFGWTRAPYVAPAQLLAVWSATTQDIQYGLLTVATLPRISAADESPSPAARSCRE